MRIRLDLSRHCIETEIKRIYNRTVSACLKPNADLEALEKVLVLTGAALKRFEFQAQRSAYPILQGGGTARAFLIQDASGEVVIVLDEARIRPGKNE